MVTFAVYVDGVLISWSHVEADRVEDAWDFMLWAFDPFHFHQFA